MNLQQFAPNLYNQLLNYKEEDFWNLFLNFCRQTRVLFLGEIHGTNNIPKLAQRLLEGLKRDGFSLLALEIPNYHHESIGTFLKTGNLKDLQKEFRAKTLQNAHYQTTSHINLVYEAHHLGYHLGFFGMSKDQHIKNEIDRDIHFSNNFLSLWRGFGDPKTVVYCGISHSTNEDKRMAGILRQELGCLSVICEAAHGHFLNLGRVESFGADIGIYGKIIGQIRPDIIYGFFDLRNDPNLQNFGDGLVYIKSVSASSVPKLGLFGRWF